MTKKIFLFLIIFSAVIINPFYRGLANDEDKINARIESWGRNCKNKVAETMASEISMSDITVELGATLKQSIDAGEMTVKDINNYGLSYNWEISKKNISGYCNTDGKGNIVEFKIF